VTPPRRRMIAAGVRKKDSNGVMRWIIRTSLWRYLFATKAVGDS
jgi:hypothetical protein